MNDSIKLSKAISCHLFETKPSNTNCCFIEIRIERNISTLFDEITAQNFSCLCCLWLPGLKCTKRHDQNGLSVETKAFNRYVILIIHEYSTMTMESAEFQFFCIFSGQSYFSIGLEKYK